MWSLDTEIAAFRDEAAKVLEVAPVITTLQEDYWLQRVASLLQPGGAATWSSELNPDGGLIDSTNWQGQLDVTLDGGLRLLVRRCGFVGSYGNMVHATLAAASSRTALERAIELAHSSWREWRRNVCKVQTARGRDVEIIPTSWDQVCLAPDVLDDIRSNINHFANARALYAELGLPYRRGLLFYGPPGNGKTLLCRAIVTSLGWPTIYVSPHSKERMADEVGNSFKEARDLAPSVLWFDDVDSLFDTDASMSSFLNQLDGASASEGVLVLATTNRPEELDPALAARPSRFDRIFEIGLPAASERRRLLATRFGSSLSEQAQESLVELTAGMSMAFVQELFVGAALRASVRGERPNEADALAVQAALAKHVRASDRGFAADAMTGFGRK